MEIRIDPEFQNKVPPLTDAEYRQLEENILESGEIREPIITWHGVIVDGHNRYKIHLAHPEIGIRTREMDFLDKWAAFDWMYKNQLGRRNLTEEQKTYLLGKLYEARKHSHGGDRKSRRQNDALKQGRVRNQIMEEMGVGQKTIERAEYYAHGIDAIRETSPELADAILTGEKKVKKRDVQTLGRAAENREDMIEAIREGRSVGERSETERACDRASGREIREIIDAMTSEECMDYTVEHLAEQIRANASWFIRVLTNLLDDHDDLIEGNEQMISNAIRNAVTVPVERIVREKLRCDTNNKGENRK